MTNRLVVPRPHRLRGIFLLLDALELVGRRRVAAVSLLPSLEVVALLHLALAELLEDDRVVRVYNEAIRLFEKAKDWENALALYNKLEKWYRFATFDYKSLAHVLKKGEKLLFSVINVLAY